MGEKHTHTPGPWSVMVQGTKRRIVSDSTYDTVATLGDDLIARLTTSPDQQAIDARLIAAAPDLLEALTDSTEHLQEWLEWAISNSQIDRSERKRLQARIAANRAAIAKALPQNEGGK